MSEPSSLKGGTLFSGIGAPELAAPDIDWRWCAEIEPFASAVHKTRFQGVPNLGDVTKIDPRTVEPVDIIVFGSPCQSFSVAGKRLGLDDPRGNLALVALRLVAALRPRWFLFENVPGLLSSEGGRDFGTFVGAVEQCGYGWAYRTLDAQHFGVPQRRRRLFVVGCLGDWRGAAAVLFEPASLRGDPAPGRAARERVAAPLTHGAESGSNGGYAGRRREDDSNLVASALKTREQYPDRDDGLDNLIANPLGSNFHGWANDLDNGSFIAHALTAEGFDASEDGTGRGPPLVTHALPTCNGGGYVTEDGTGHGIPLVAAFDARQSDVIQYGDRAGPLDTDGYSQAALTLAIRGRGDSHDLEWRDDGTANAILTPNGGRAGIGVGAVAFKPGQSEAAGGVFISEEYAPTLQAVNNGSTAVPAVAFRIHSNNSVSGAHEAATAATLDKDAGSSSGRSSQGRNVILDGVAYGETAEAHATALLRALRHATDEETLSQWGLGILDQFWPQEVLRSEVHGSRVRCPPQPKRGLVNISLSCAKTGGAWSVRDLWEAGCAGCPSQGWQPSEQLARQLGAYLSQLPYAPSPAQRFLHALWEAAEGLGLLRQALSAVQEARQSACSEGQPVRSGSAGNGKQPGEDVQDFRLHEEASCEWLLQPSQHAGEPRQAGGMSVRRLLVEECEALMGLPRSFTAITYRGKPAADGPRYRALGNSMAVPCVRWILSRLVEIAAMSEERTSCQ